MPFVQIHVVEGRRSPEELRTLADVVQQVMLDDFAAPWRDRYQTITEHRPGSIIAEDTGLGYSRTDDIVIIAITQQGRTREQKQTMYAAMARALREQTGLDPENLIISLTENTREDWSFGEGRAQFLDGGLP